MAGQALCSAPSQAVRQARGAPRRDPVTPSYSGVTRADVERQQGEIKRSGVT